MTHHVVDDEVLLLEQSLMENLARLDALSDFALKRSDRAPQLPGLSRAEVALLNSDEGRAELARLLLAFRESTRLLFAYRNDLAHQRVRPRVEDLQEVLEASERPLGALRRRLARIVAA